MPGWKPSRMLPECSQAKPSCEPGAFHSRGSTSPISIVAGCPRERSRLISRARLQKVCADAKILVGGFRKPVRCSIQKLRSRPKPSHRKQRDGEDQLAFTILDINLLPLFAFTYFVVLPVSLTY